MNYYCRFCKNKLIAKDDSYETIRCLHCIVDNEAVGAPKNVPLQSRNSLHFVSKSDYYLGSHYREAVSFDDYAIDIFSNNNIMVYKYYWSEIHHSLFCKELLNISDLEKSFDLNNIEEFKKVIKLWATFQ